MTANNDYWAQRTRANAEKAAKQAASYARRLKSVQRRAADEIDRYLADLLLDISTGGTPTRTQLWTAGKYLKLRDCIQQQCSDVGQRQKDLLDELLPNLFNDILETNLADFKAADSPFSFLPTRMIRQSLDTAWSGQNYSSRIWTNTNALAERLEQDIVDYIVLGKSRTQITAAIRDDFRVSYSKADRLFRTESAHVATEAAKESYKRANISKVKWIHGNGHCDCPICTERDGKIYDVDNVPTLPAHPNCVCCLAPVVDLTVDESNDILNFSQEDLQAITNKFPKYKQAIPVKHGVLLNHTGNHAERQLAKRGITLEDAQHYIDTALICFKQSEDKTMFLSEDGVAAVLDNGGIATAYPRSWYMGDIWELLEEVKKYGRRK